MKLAIQSLAHQFLIIFLVSIPLLGQSQKKPADKKQYFDADWQPVKDSTRAIYYRTVEQQQDKFLVKDFYRSPNQLQMVAICSQVTPKLVRDGEATFYYENGNLQRAGLYANDLPTGVHKSYYKTGEPRSVIIHRGEDELFAEYWSEEGASVLHNGTGFITDNENEETVYIEVKDSVQLAGYVVSASDTIYILTQSPAEYKGGMQAFHSGVGKNIVYPKPARRNGVEGTVFVQFEVYETGTPAQAKVLRGIGSGCDEAAVQACMQQQNWQPASHKGRAVKSRMVLPIIFRLR